MKYVLDNKFWDRDNKKWDTKLALNTISHCHVACYPINKDGCDLSIIECADGKTFIEDRWGDLNMNNEFVFNPYTEANEILLFDNFNNAIATAKEIVSKETGTPVENLDFES